MDLTKKVVKIKKLQALSSVNPTHIVILPKKWIDEMGWNRTTQLVLEFLPHRKMIIISENEKNSNTKPS